MLLSLIRGDKLPLPSFGVSITKSSPRAIAIPDTGLLGESSPGGDAFSISYDHEGIVLPPAQERLEKFREVRDQIEQKILDWLEHPEEELAKLREYRELERTARIEATRREAEGGRNSFAVPESSGARHTSGPGLPQIAAAGPVCSHPDLPKRLLPQRL
jgi:hypothetical protein